MEDAGRPGEKGGQEAERQSFEKTIGDPVKGRKGLGRHSEGREVLGGKSRWRLGIKMRCSQG